VKHIGKISLAIFGIITTHLICVLAFNAYAIKKEKEFLAEFTKNIPGDQKAVFRD
jgi:hypothetical protein